MKKLVLALVVLAFVGALAYLVTSSDDGAAGGAGSKAKPGEEADAPALGTTPAVEKPQAAQPKKTRQHAAETPTTLAVAGVVVGSDGAPLAGATVEAYAVPEGDDLPDDERMGRDLVFKALGKESGGRLWKRVQSMKKKNEKPDAGETVSMGIDAAMDMFSEEGGLESLTSLIGGARSSMLAPDGPWTKVGAATSGADGAFRVEVLEKGRLELRAKAPGRVRTKTRVDAGQLEVRISLEQGVRIAGVVLREKAPVVGARVAIQGAATETGAGGRFEFDAAHVPMEQLLASADGCVSQVRTLQLSLEKPPAELEISLAPAGTVKGHVAALGGGAVGGARVSMAASDNILGSMMAMANSMTAPSDLPPQPAVSDVNGEFELRGVKTGAVKLNVDAEGYLRAVVPVDVKKDEVATCVALLVKESTLAGDVKDEHGAPIVGARVRVEAPAPAGLGQMAALLGPTFKSATTDENGAYVVHGLIEGERKVRVEAEKKLTLEDKATIQPQSASRRDFVLKEGFKIAGVVSAPDGKGHAGAKIYVTAKPADSGGSLRGMMAMFGARSSGEAAAETASDGSWTADGLQEGPYVVKASAEGFLDVEEKDVAAGRADVALVLGAAATIRGRVVSAEDTKPVAHAEVQREKAGGKSGAKNPMARFSRMFGGGAGSGSATTSDEGVFEMKGIEPGEYELKAKERGFADSEAVKVVVAAGQTVEDVLLVLQPGVTVSGRVVEKATGAAVPDAVVWAGSDGGFGGGFAMSDITGGEPKAPDDSIQAKTDVDGRFSLIGLNPGKTTIEVRVADHAPGRLANVVAPATEVVVTVSPGGHVEGTVTDAAGAPVEDAQVMVMRGMQGDGMRQSKTNAKGEFRLERLAAGGYTLMLLDMKNPMAPTMASVTVKDGETTRHDFTKKTSGKGKQVAGGVTRDGKPMAGAMVVLMGGPGGMKVGTSGDDGRFAFEDLEPGEYTVMAQSGIMGGGGSSKKVTVGAEGRVEDVRLEFSSAKVEGVVLDGETGKGVAGAQIHLAEPGAKLGSMNDMLTGHKGQGFTDESGRFSIADVPNGVFTLRVSAGDYVPAVVDGVASNSLNVKVTLHRGGEFEVTVLGPDGQPVANATVQSVDEAGRESLGFDMTMRGVTDAEGSAVLRLGSGRYTLKVTAPSLLPASVEVDAAAGEATVKLDAGATIEVVVSNPEGPVKGAKVVVKDAAGREIQRGIDIGAFFGGGDVTDGEGKFTRAGLPTGSVTVVVTPPGREPTTTETTLEPGKTRTLPVTAK